MTKRTFEEINSKIKEKKAVILTAEELIDLVKDQGIKKAAEKVDVITTGTFGPMCSSGILFNFPHPRRKIKASKVWLNRVEAYGGLAAADAFLGATQVKENDALNNKGKGNFDYGGGHVITDLISKNSVRLEAESYGTDCYPVKTLSQDMRLEDFKDIHLLNVRNAYQNYNVGVNTSSKTIYTYMGILRPNLSNANYCSAGQLSPLLADPYLRTIGLGTKIFLGGAQGWVIGEGTQHNPNPWRTEDGVPIGGSGTLSVRGNLKQMDRKWVRGVSFKGYGTSLAVGIGIPIPVLDEDTVKYASLGDARIKAPVVDYAYDYPNGTPRNLGLVSYKDLKSGSIRVNGKVIHTAPLSSYPGARQIAAELKHWIELGTFKLGIPQDKESFF